MFRLGSIPLADAIPRGKRLRFVSADIPINPALPFVVVHYMVDGVASPLGLRADLDKRVILDRMDNPGLQKELDEAAAVLFEYLASEEVRSLIDVSGTYTLGANVTLATPLQRFAGASGAGA